MAEFRDSSNFKWTISLPVGAVARVKKDSDGKFNLFDPASKCGDGRTLHEALNEDLGEFWELLWHLLSPQASAALPPVSPEQFGERMQGDELLQAQAAFWKEWADFFRRLQRQDISLLLEKEAKRMELARVKLEAAMKDPRLSKLDAKIEEEVDAVMKQSFGALWESLEPTQIAAVGVSLT